MKQPTEPTKQNTRRPAEVEVISITTSIYIILSISGLITSLLILPFQPWAEVEIIPFHFPFIMLTIIILLVKINFDFLKLIKWALYAMFILQFIYILGSVYAIIVIGTPFIQIVSIINIGMSALNLNYLNKSSVKQAFGL